MGRGYIFAVTLAALAAVFLQGCGKAAAPATPAPTSVTTTITSPVTKGSTVIPIASNAGMGINSKITITDPSTKKSEVNGIKGFGSIILMAPLQNDYGVGSTVTMYEADMGKATLASVITASTVIESIRPEVIVPNVTTTITLKGPEVAGDAMAFVGVNELCNSTDVTPTSMLAVTYVDRNTSTVAVPYTSVPTAGDYSICYRQSGRTDLVKQTFGKLAVQLAAGATKVSQISPVEATQNTAGKVFTLTSDLSTLDEYKGAFVPTGQPCPLASTVTSWKDVTVLNASTKTFQLTVDVGSAGTYELCLTKETLGSSAPSKQTDAKTKLTVKAATSSLWALMEADDSDNTKPGSSSSTNIVLGAGGLMLVAFVAMRVAFVAFKRANSHANEEQNLEAPLE